MIARAMHEHRVLNLGVGLGALAVLSVMAAAIAYQPLLAVGAMAVTVLALAFSSSAGLTTAAVLFVLYTNAPVVAVKFHGVPMAAAAAIPVLLLVPVFSNVFGRQRGILVAPALPWIALFLLIQLTGAVFAPRSDVALEKVATSFVEGALLYLLIVNAVRTPEALKQAMWALCLAGLFMGAIVTHQQITRGFDRDYYGFGQVTDAVYGADEDDGGSEETGQPRLAGPIGEKNRFGQIMAVLLPLAFALYRGSPGRRERLLAMLAMALIAIGVAVSLSRGAAIGLAAGFVVLVLFGYVRLRQLGLVLAVTVFALALVPNYSDRLLALRGAEAALGGQEARRRGAPVEGTVRGRATEMAAAVLMFADHPVLGVGPGMYHHHYRQYARRAGGKVDHGGRQPHSLYLGLAAEHGLAGLIAFFGIALVTLRDLRRAGRFWRSHRPELAGCVAGIFGALVVYLVSAVFLHLAYARYLWLLLALGAAASCLPSERRTEAPR